MPVIISGATSGATTVQATDAVTATITLPSATDTLVGKATTDTLTNKTLTLPVVGTTIGVGGATPSASGSGITFPATQSASTNANTLDDYEEGTWTPVPTALVGSFTTVGTVSGTYTKVGRMVVVQSSIIITNKGTGSVGMHVTGLPFSIRNDTYAGGGFNSSNAINLTIIPAGANTVFDVYKYDGSDPVNNTQQLNITFTYFT